MALEQFDQEVHLVGTDERPSFLPAYPVVALRLPHLRGQVPVLVSGLRSRCPAKSKRDSCSLQLGCRKRSGRSRFAMGAVNEVAGHGLTYVQNSSQVTKRPRETPSSRHEHRSRASSWWQIGEAMAVVG